jgi:hypothetical protein
MPASIDWTNTRIACNRDEHNRTAFRDHGRGALAELTKSEGKGMIPRIESQDMVIIAVLVFALSYLLAAAIGSHIRWAAYRRLQALCHGLLWRYPGIIMC